MGNMVVCSSLAIGAAWGGRRAPRWIHPTWSACAELPNVRERDLNPCGNESNEQRCSDCHTQRAEGRKEGRRRKQDQALAPSHPVPVRVNARAAEKLAGWDVQKGDESSGHVTSGVGFADVCVRQKHAVHEKLSLAVSSAHSTNR